MFEIFPKKSVLRKIAAAAAIQAIIMRTDMQGWVPIVGSAMKAKALRFPSPRYPKCDTSETANNLLTVALQLYVVGGLKIEIESR